MGTGRVLYFGRKSPEPGFQFQIKARVWSRKISDKAMFFAIRRHFFLGSETKRVLISRYRCAGAVEYKKIDPKCPRFCKFRSSKVAIFLVLEPDFDKIVKNEPGTR